MREIPESLSYGEYLPAVYRFAFLMMGSPTVAADVLRRVVEHAERSGLGEVREATRVKRWLFARARALCAQPVPTALMPVPVLATSDEASPFTSSSSSLSSEAIATVPMAEDPPAQLARHFAALPEKERCALILFYLYLFDSVELAEVLGIVPEELGPLLLRGRAMIQKRMKDEG